MLTCGLRIALAKIALKAAGFAAVVRWIEERPQRAPRSGILTREAVVALEYRVAIAGALFPGRALCLEQSLVLYDLLRRRAVPATFRLGVVPHPFSAHAWVEYNGGPLNDVPEHVESYTPLASHSR